MLDCKHICHADCLKEKLLSKWQPPNISFGYLQCNTCRKPAQVDHKRIQRIIGEFMTISRLIMGIDKDRELEQKVIQIAVDSAKNEGLDQDPGKFLTQNWPFGP